MPLKAPRPPKPAAETRAILKKLERQHPNADTELHYRTPYELLVATILSAQCTDERVNQVTPALFARYPDARTLAKATTGELEPQIQSTGFFRSKSKSLLGMAKSVTDTYGGTIPASMDALTELPGVGRKTANVVLGHALGVPGLPVDRHVLRVANRIGIAKSEDPEVVEQQLGSALPPEKWIVASDTLILHGRRVCKPKPLCETCAVLDDCLYYQKVVSRVRKPQGTGNAAARGRLASRARKPQGTGNAAARGRLASRVRKPQGTGNAAASGRLASRVRKPQGTGNAAARGRLARAKK